VVIATAALLGAACGQGVAINPQPIPVNGDDVAFDSAKIGTRPAGAGSLAYSIVGAPGAFSRGPAQIWAFDLSRSVRGAADVAGDGSFTITMFGAPSDLFRLSAAYSDPASSMLYLASSELHADSDAGTAIPLGCTVLSNPPLLVTPATSLGATASVSATLASTCSASPTPTIGWISGDAFSVAGGLSLPAGQERRFTVAFKPSAPGLDPEVIVIEVGDTRTSLALFGNATP
jgi:hypothetical protein